MTIPIAGTIGLEVEAESAEEAKEKAWEQDVDTGEVDYELLEHITEGNVLYASQNYIGVEEIK